MGESFTELGDILLIPYDTSYNDRQFLTQGAREQMKNHITPLFEYVASSIQDLDVTQGRRSLGNVNVLPNAMGV
jgi:hypothetical protein